MRCAASWGWSGAAGSILFQNNNSVSLRVASAQRGNINAAEAVVGQVGVQQVGGIQRRQEHALQDQPASLGNVPTASARTACWRRTTASIQPGLARARVHTSSTLYFRAGPADVHQLGPQCRAAAAKASDILASMPNTFATLRTASAMVLQMEAYLQAGCNNQQLFQRGSSPEGAWR